jgi:hypothetical protein
VTNVDSKDDLESAQSDDGFVGIAPLQP